MVQRTLGDAVGAGERRRLGPLSKTCYRTYNRIEAMADKVRRSINRATRSFLNLELVDIPPANHLNPVFW